MSELDFSAFTAFANGQEPPAQSVTVTEGSTPRVMGLVRAAAFLLCYAAWPHADSARAAGLIQPAGSGSSLVSSILLSHKHSHGPVPRSLADLLLYAIAIDTKGLKSGLAVDVASAEALFPHSHYAEDKDEFKKVMKDIGKEMKKAKKALDHLTVWELIQRDWKGDIVYDSTIPIVRGPARSLLSSDLRLSSAPIFCVSISALRA